MKKYSVLVAVLMVFALTFSTFAGSFADVPADHWSYDAVNQLVASGLIEGYPDGTFKGQNNLTRYEVAMVMARLLEDIQAEREKLAADLDASNKSLSSSEAQQVTAIVEAMLAKNLDGSSEGIVVSTDYLSDGQADQVIEIVKALTFTYANDIEALGVDIDRALGDISDIEARVAALEAQSGTAAVTWGGEYSVELNDYSYDNVPADLHEDSEDGVPYNPFDYDPEEEDDFMNNEDNAFKHSLDLNVGVNTDVLDADFDLTVVANTFAVEPDETDFDLDSLEGTLTGEDFTATIGEEQEEGIKPYLFNGYDDDGDWEGPEVNGVVLKTAGNTFLLHGEDELFVATDESGDPVSVDAHVFASHIALDSLYGINLYTGLAKPFGFPTYITDEDVEVDENNLISVIGLDKTFDVAEFEITPDFAVSELSDYYFTLNANGDLGPVAAEFNYKNIEADFFPLVAEDFTWEKGFDVKGEMTVIDRVDLLAYFESYNETDFTVDYDDDASVPWLELGAEVTEDNAYEVAEIALFGDAAYYNYTDVDDAVRKTVNFNAKRDLADFNFHGQLDWENTDSAYIGLFVEDDDEDLAGVEKGDMEEEKFDKILDIEYNGIENLTAGAHYLVNNDNDLAEHEYNAEYVYNIIKAGAVLTIETDGYEDSEQELYVSANEDKEEAYNYFDIDFKPYAKYTTWLQEEVRNIEAGIEAEKELNQYAVLAAGYDYANMEKDTADEEYLDDGVLNKVWANVSYSITEDVTAEAEAMHMVFDAENDVNDYTADVVKAGVSVAF